MSTVNSAWQAPAPIAIQAANVAYRVRGMG